MRFGFPVISNAFSRAAANRWRAACFSFALCCVPHNAQAAADPAADSAPDSSLSTQADSNGPKIAFESDTITYKNDDDIVTASGNVVLHRADRSLRADKVSWNRNTGKIIASGNIRMVDEDGNQLFTEQVELTDELKVGTMQAMLMALREGGRLAANGGKRDADGKVTLDHISYSGCAVEDSNNCPKRPTWQITSRTVVYDPDKKQLSFSGAHFILFGAKLLPLPRLLIATDGRAISGPLIPDIRLSSTNGLEIYDTYYLRLANNRDLALTGYVYTRAVPLISAQYRALTGSGAFQITGYLTASDRIPVSGGNTNTQQEIRGYIAGNGHFQLSSDWSLSFAGRVASDRTFLRRYGINNDDILRSSVALEHISPNSYFSISGWAFQTVRPNDRQGLVPIALPEIDYRWRLPKPILGGKLEILANSLAITRTGGQDTQRAFASARWDLRRITKLGQVVTLTGLLRGDVYHSSDNAQTATALYRGLAGWQTRGVATAAVDVQWPLAGPLWGGTQVLTPHLQIVATPRVPNLSIPNEDSRAIELQESNLFALNRFPGNDRIEDGARVTYGFDWQVERPRWRIATTIGQSFRLTSKPAILPPGTGLSDRSSDIVGRTEIRYRNNLKLTHRFRLDKTTLAFRRNEVDATIGNDRDYLELGYSRLNRNIPATVEDLTDSEDVRAAARLAFARYWSLFGSGVFNLSTHSNQNAALNSTGFQALRTRLGVSYQDGCIEASFTWRRDFVTIGDASRGNTFELHLALHNLGFR